MFPVFTHQGRSEDPAEHEIELTTAPSVDYGTHWANRFVLRQLLGS